MFLVAMVERRAAAYVSSSGSRRAMRSAWYEAAVAVSFGESESCVIGAAENLEKLCSVLGVDKNHADVVQVREEDDPTRSLAAWSERTMVALKQALSEQSWPRVREATSRAGFGDEAAACLGAAAACAGACSSTEFREAASLVNRLVPPTRERREIGTRAVRAALLAEVVDVRAATMMARAFAVSSAVDDEAAMVVASRDDDDLAAACSLAVQVRPWSKLDPEILVDRCVERELWDSSSEIIASLARDDARKEFVATKVVRSAMAAKQFRQADSIASRFDQFLPPELVDLARLEHARSTVTKLCAKSQFSIVERIVENDTVEVKRIALAQLQLSRQHALADKLASAWDMREHLVGGGETLEELIAKDKAWRAQHYLQWSETRLAGKPLPQLVCDPDRVQQALANAFGTAAAAGDQGRPLSSFVLGFDVEWGASGKAALLQIASRDAVVLLDLMELTASESGMAALATHVAPLCISPRLLVGFGISHDLTTLRASGPWFPREPNVFDIQQAVLLSSSSSSSSSGGAKKKSKKALAPGLAAVSSTYLGKPLDKTEQCGKWESRPLTEAQRTYAALDAWVCAEIYSMLK